MHELLEQTDAYDPLDQISHFSKQENAYHNHRIIQKFWEVKDAVIGTDSIYNLDRKPKNLFFQRQERLCSRLEYFSLMIGNLIIDD
ncbi:MAG: hypothetical protein ABL890_04140 [Candidatus Peribacteraceae bacterium]